jgi:uncharacterized membrane protein YdfJ with MMPL/SSD domain
VVVAVVVVVVAVAALVVVSEVKVAELSTMTEGSPHRSVQKVVDEYFSKLFGK